MRSLSGSLGKTGRWAIADSWLVAQRAVAGALLDDFLSDVANDGQLEHLALISFVSRKDQAAEHGQEEGEEEQAVNNPHQHTQDVRDSAQNNAEYY